MARHLSADAFSPSGSRDSPGWDRPARARNRRNRQFQRRGARSGPDPTETSSNSTRARWSSCSRSRPMVFAMVSSISATVASMMCAAPPPPSRQVQERAPPVVGSGMPGDIAQGDQGLDELTDGLFGDPHTGYEITAAQTRLRPGQCAHSPDPALGKIAEPPCHERLGDGGRVAPHGAAEEPAERLRIARRRQTGA